MTFCPSQVRDRGWNELTPQKKCRTKTTSCRGAGPSPTGIYSSLNGRDWPFESKTKSSPTRFISSGVGISSLTSNVAVSRSGGSFSRTGVLGVGSERVSVGGVIVVASVLGSVDFVVEGLEDVESRGLVVGCDALSGAGAAVGIWECGSDGWEEVGSGVAACGAPSFVGSFVADVCADCAGGLGSVVAVAGVDAGFAVAMTGVAVVVVCELVGNVQLCPSQEERDWRKM